MSNSIETSEEPTLDDSALYRNSLQMVQKNLAEMQNEEPVSKERIIQLQEKITNAIQSRVIEASELINWQAQYDEAIATLKAFKLLPNTPSSLEDVQGAFSRDMLRAVETLCEPKLHLVPNVSFAAQVRAMDESNFAKNPICVDVEEDVYGSMHHNGKRENITALHPVFIESAQEMPLPFDIDERLTNRMNTAKANRIQGQEGMDRHLYAALQMDALRRGVPADIETWTILDDDKACTKDFVPDGGFESTENQVEFDKSDLSIVATFVRFRSSVKGNVLEL